MPCSPLQPCFRAVLANRLARCTQGHQPASSSSLFPSYFCLSLRHWGNLPRILSPLPHASISSQHPLLVLLQDVPFLFLSLHLCTILCLIVSLCFVCLCFSMGGFMGAVTGETLNTLPHTPGLAPRRHLVHYLWSE